MVDKHIYEAPWIEAVSIKGNDVILASGVVQSGETLSVEGFGGNGWE